jgi:hypothetical protein
MLSGYHEEKGKKESTYGKTQVIPTEPITIRFLHWHDSQAVAPRHTRNLQRPDITTVSIYSRQPSRTQTSRSRPNKLRMTSPGFGHMYKVSQRMGRVSVSENIALVAGFDGEDRAQWNCGFESEIPSKLVGQPA